MPEQHGSDALSAVSGSDLDQCLARARAGDVLAFETLCGRVSPRIEGHLRRILRSDADAASAALQDAWSAASQRLSKFESGRHLVYWLLRVAKCRAISDLRKGHRTITTPWQECPEDEARGPALPGVMDARNGDELRVTLRTAIANLPDIYRGIATLHFLYGQGPREVSVLHSLRLSTVKMRLHRARLRLRRSLRGVEPP